MRIGILEDEAIVIRDLKIRLEHMGFQVVATCTQGLDFIQAVLSENVELCLVDINLGGGMNGVETVAKIKETLHLPVIYITAQGDEETFLQAKNTHPSAYLLKPYNEFEIRAAIELAIHNFEKSNIQEDKDFKVIEDKIFFKYKNRFEKLELKDILYMEASGNYTLIHTASDKTYTMVQHLGRFSGLLSDDYLFRCHRSFIVNLHKMDGFDENYIFIGTAQIPLSRMYKKDMLERLRIIS